MFLDSALHSINVLPPSIFFLILLMLLFQPYIEASPPFAFEDYALIFPSVKHYLMWWAIGEKWPIISWTETRGPQCSWGLREFWVRSQNALLPPPRLRQHGFLRFPRPVWLNDFRNSDRKDQALPSLAAFFWQFWWKQREAWRNVWVHIYPNLLIVALLGKEGLDLLWFPLSAWGSVGTYRHPGGETSPLRGFLLLLLRSCALDQTQFSTPLQTLSWEHWIHIVPGRLGGGYPQRIKRVFFFAFEAAHGGKRMVFAKDPVFVLLVTKQHCTPAPLHLGQSQWKVDRSAVFSFVGYFSLSFTSVAVLKVTCLDGSTPRWVESWPQFTMKKAILEHLVRRWGG